MGLLSIAEMAKILKKYFLRIVAISLVVGLLAGFVGGKVAQTDLNDGTDE